MNAKECSALTPQFCSAFEESLHKRFKLSPNETLQACIETLKTHNLCKFETPLSPTLFLCHRLNRGSLMLNYQRVHLNAKTIHFGGADANQLGNSYCIELSLSGDHRRMNLLKNRDLVKRSGGLIADINDSEKYLSLGCGHTVAFCKAAVAGTKTCEPEIAGRDGTIDRALLERNPVFKKMITTGWGWWVIPAEVDIKYPEFARICQKALNIANQVGQEIGDLEVGMTIVEYIEDTDLYADADWKQRIVALVKDSGASCAGWTPAIITFVEEFSGGKDGPLM